MADYNTAPIAAQIRPPQVMSLSDMMNFSRAAQQYRQSEQMNPLLLQGQQQEVARGGISLEQETQKNQERLALQKMMQDTPYVVMTNGMFDPEKLNRIVPKLAPYTGQDFISKYTTLGTAQNNLMDSANKLNQDDRSVIAGPLAMLGRLKVTDPKVYINELDVLKNQYQNNPNAIRLIEAQKTIIGQMQPGEHLAEGAIRASQSLLNPAQQQTSFNVSPSERMKATGEVDINNQPIYDVRDASGRVIGQTTVPTSVPANQLPGAPQTPQPGGVNQMRQQLQPTSQPLGIMRIPPGQTAKTGETYLTEANESRGSVQPAKVGLQNIDTILKYLPLAEVGKFSEARQAMQSVMGNIAGSKPDELAASAREIIQKTIADLSIQKNTALGGKFAASLDAAQKSLADAEKNPTAIVKSMEQLRPLLQNITNYSIGLDKAIEKSPVKQYVKPEFDSAFNEAFDPKALSFKSAFEQGKDLKKYAKENNISLVEQERLLNKIQAYDYLTNGDLAGYKAFTASLNRRR